MGRAANRTLAWAVVVSLLLHLIAAGSLSGVWPPPEATLDFPIEAHLEAAPERPAPAPEKKSPPKPEPASRPAAAPPNPAPVPAPAPEPESTPPTAQPEPTPSPPSAETAPKTTKPESPPPARLAIRDLPAEIVMNYALQIGDSDDNAFVAGRASYIWHSGKGRYSMVSTLRASGLTALFVHGQIIQTSQGRIDDDGLKPEQYWLEKTGKKEDSARFDWAANQLILGSGKGAQPLQPQAQDLLSFPFHLAMTMHEGAQPFELWVTDGRKFRDYAFRLVGTETLDLGGKPSPTLHVQGSRAGEGTLDVWLDLKKSGLPVRIRTRDEKGKTMVLRLEGASSRVPEIVSGG